MPDYLVIGAGFALAAGLQPGPLQAFLLARVVQNGWRRTLPAALAPLLSDGPIALLVLLLLDHLPEAMHWALQAAGGLFLLRLAWGGYRQWRQHDLPAAGATVSPPRTMLQAAMINVLNPNPYLGWSLVLGPASMAAWRQGPAGAILLVAAFYATLVAVLAATVLLFGTTRFLGANGRRRVGLISACLLLALGLHQLHAAAGVLLGRAT